MKILLSYIAFVLTVTSCSTSKSIIYSFESKNVSDSIAFHLKKSELLHRTDYQNIKWFALVRENSATYEVLINEEFGGKDSPLMKVIKNTNRYIQIIDGFKIPVVFESDILSLNMWKNSIGSINWGGYYFKITKENGEYKVIETGFLF